MKEKDTEKLVKIANCMGQLSMHSSKLVEIIDIQRRVDEHDWILKTIPREIIADAKRRTGI